MELMSSTDHHSMKMNALVITLQQKKKRDSKTANTTNYYRHKTNNTINILLISSILLFCLFSTGKSSSSSSSNYTHLGGGVMTRSSTTGSSSSSSDDDGSAILVVDDQLQLDETDHHLHEQRTEEEEEEENNWEMVERKGKQFVMKESGGPFYINGFNTYWLMLFAVDLSTRGKVTDLFQQASSVGLSVCRTWAFNDGGWRALQKSPSLYDEDVFKALDFVVSEAKKYKIRVILSLVNDGDAFGGKPQYVKWGREAGLNLTSNDDFFSHPTLKTYYKNHVKTVLTRVNTYTNVTYKDDPTIFAWELMNEPRCLSDPSGDQLQAWIQEMAIHVKSIDPKHMLEIGLEGFYGASTPERVGLNPNTFAQQVGTDFIRNHQALGVDFASVHIYPDSWISQSISEAHIEFVRSWMKSHMEDAEKKLGGMPVVFAEFGVSRKDNGYNSSFKDTLISTVYGTILDSTKKGGCGGGSLLWQLFPDGTDYMDDGYAIVLSKSQSTANIISLQSARLTMFNSLCSWRCRWGCKKKKKIKKLEPIFTT